MQPVELPSNTHTRFVKVHDFLLAQLLLNLGKRRRMRRCHPGFRGECPARVAEAIEPAQCDALAIIEAGLTGREPHRFVECAQRRAPAILACVCHALLMQRLRPLQVSRWIAAVQRARQNCMAAMPHTNRKTPARVVFHVGGPHTQRLLYRIAG